MILSDIININTITIIIDDYLIVASLKIVSYFHYYNHIVFIIQATEARTFLGVYLLTFFVSQIISELCDEMFSCMKRSSFQIKA